MLDYAYLAGIVDGEGTITLTKNNQHSMFRKPVVSVSNTDTALIEWIKARFGGKVSNRVSRNPRHKPAFEWRLEYNKALEMLGMIAPFLRVSSKKKRAQYIILHYKDVTRRNGRYSANEAALKSAFESTVLSF